jgi:hypothetical protein
MKINKTIVVFLLILFFSPTFFCFAQDNVKIPVAVLVEKVYVLKNVVEGTMVTHDFIMKNQGTATLVIENVKSG